MAGEGQAIDVAKNARTVDWLRAELTAGLANTFRAMWRGRDEEVAESLAGLVMLSYLLGRRLGIGYPRLDGKVLAGLRRTLEDGHEIETWYGDMSALAEHWQTRRGGAP